MLVSVVMRKELTFNKMGIDMSRAFDTVKRDTIMRVLEDAECSKDDMRLVQYLLSSTNLCVRVGSSLSEDFERMLGAFRVTAYRGSYLHLYWRGL